MAKWIGDTRAAKHKEESDVVAEPEVVGNTHATAWKPVMVTKAKANILHHWLPQRLMQALAEVAAE